MSIKYEDRLLTVSRIESNPFRDFDIYPIHPERVEELSVSYKDNDFGTIIPVRPHPTIRGVYQQACGHHRIAVMRETGKPLEILCRIADWSDTDMVSIMVRENANNYGNNPEALSDSVAAVCKLLSYWMFLSDSKDHLSVIHERCRDLLSSAKAFDTAKAQLVRDNQIGEPLIYAYLGGKGRSPLSREAIKNALANLNSTGKMVEIVGTQRTRVERELEAEAEAERKRAEIAARKAKEAAEELARWEAAEAARKERRKQELAEAKAMKESLAKAQAEARLAKEKADADREKRRMEALRKEQERIKAEQEALKTKRDAIEKRREQAEKARENAEKSTVEPFISKSAFGLFDNQNQFNAFRAAVAANKHLFPVDGQPDYIRKMMQTIASAEGDVSAKAITAYMRETDTKWQARQREMAQERQRELERHSKQAKVDRVMEEMQTSIGRCSAMFAELHQLLQDPELAAMAHAHPYGMNMRSYIEGLERVLPDLKRLIKLQSRSFEPAVIDSSVIN